jgi:hypothetical protein
MGKYIKTFEGFDSDFEEGTEADIIKKLDSPEQQIVVRKSVFDNYDRIIQVGGTWERAVETEDFIYFCDFSGDSDDNSSTLMFRKKDLSLVSDNYFATNDLVGVIEDRTYTWIGKDVLFNFTGEEE